MGRVGTGKISDRPKWGEPEPGKKSDKQIFLPAGQHNVKVKTGRADRCAKISFRGL